MGCEWLCVVCTRGENSKRFHVLFFTISNLTCISSDQGKTKHKIFFSISQTYISTFNFASFQRNSQQRLKHVMLTPCFCLKQRHLIKSHFCLFLEIFQYHIFHEIKKKMRKYYFRLGDAGPKKHPWFAQKRKF